MKNTAIKTEDLTATLGEVLESSGQMEKIEQVRRELTPIYRFFRNSFAKSPTLAAVGAFGVGFFVGRILR